MTGLTGCEKTGISDIIGGSGMIVDWSPVNVIIQVTDGHGADLLDPENPNNMIDGTSITFQGKTYEASREDRLSAVTKEYLALIYGLRLKKFDESVNKNAKGYYLIFGEIDGAKDMDEDLVVTLPNGMTCTIHYHCSKHNENKLSCKRSWKFNGTKHEGNIFTFVVTD